MRDPGPGDLKHRGTIQQDSGTPDSLGETVPNWTTVATAWAAIEPASGHEFWQTKQTQADVTHTLTFRWRGDLTLTAAMRFLFGSRVFHFVERPRDLGERHEWWEVLAKEAT